MKLKGKAKVLFYKQKSFAGKDGKPVSYLNIEFADELMNKFSATVPEIYKSAVDLQVSEEPHLIDGDIEILLTRAEKVTEGKTVSYNKLQVISFTKNK